MATGDSPAEPRNTDLMLKLEHDQLTFTFPEIAWQLTALLEQHIQQLRPKFHLPEDRSTLVEALRRFLHSNPEFQLRSDPEQTLYATAKSLTEADVENAFRESAYEVARLHDELAGANSRRSVTVVSPPLSSTQGRAWPQAPSSAKRASRAPTLRASPSSASRSTGIA